MNNTPKRILVPTDFSPASNSAISLAKAISGRFGAEVHQLHVRVLLDDPDVDSETLDEIERILEVSKAEPTNVGEGAEEHESAQTFTHVNRGIVAPDGIVEGVSEYDCDLVIMGTHGRRGFRRLLTGSVAQEVVHRSPVPVLTTRAKVGALFPPQKVLVAVDFSEHSFEAIKYAGVWASALDAELVLLHVVQPMVYPDFYAIDALPEEHRERIVKCCHQSLTDAAEKYLIDVPFKTAVREGHIASQVCSFAKENSCDLVVLATRGLSGFSHALLGSVAERVVGRSEIPVLTVRVGS